MKPGVCSCLLLSLLSLEAMSQEGTYYFGSNSRPVENLEEALTIQEVKKRSEKRYIIETTRKEEDRWIQDQKERIRILGDGSQRILFRANTFFPKRIYREMERTGPGAYLFRETTLSNTLRTGSSSSFLPLHLEGSVTEYHPNGEKKSVSFYRDNQLVANENWLPDGSKYIDSIFFSVDQVPEYQMGDEFFNSFILKNLSNSKLDLTQVEDQVVIGWVVMETGNIEGVIAMKGKSRQLNEFLVKTIASLPGYWTPAVLNGSRVRYFMSIPLNFMQRDASFQEVEFSSGVMHYNRY